MPSAVLKCMRAVDAATAKLRDAKPSAKETAEAELVLARADLALAVNAGPANPSAKATYKKKTTTVEEEEDDGVDDDDDGDEDGDEEEAEEKAEKMPPSEEEEAEEEESAEAEEEEEMAAKAAVASAKRSLAAATTDKSRAVRTAKLSAARQHLKACREKAMRSAMTHVTKLRAEVRSLTKAMQGTAKVAASNRKLRERMATLERFAAATQLNQPDVGASRAAAEATEPSAEQKAIWTKMGLSAEDQVKAQAALIERHKFVARVTAPFTGKGN